MSDRDAIVGRLQQHRTLAKGPLDELRWLADHGELQPVQPGYVVSSAAKAVTSLVIVLSGKFAIHVDHGYGPRKVMEWSAGDISGMLPYSRMTKPPGDAVVTDPGELLLVSQEHFPEMTRSCPWLTTALVHVMVDRARVFTSSGLQDEKMASLGRLAAGLAHELNNPASAAARSAGRLEEGLARAEAASRALGAARLSPDQLAAVDELRQTCLASNVPMLSAMDRADREESVSSWLESRGLSSASASALIDAGVTSDLLDHFSKIVPAAATGIALEWVASNCAIHSLAVEVQRASSRIHHLVAAVKRFTYMDKPGVPEPVNIEQALRDTVAVLGSKARDKRVTVSVTVPPDLPAARGYGGELNQVWSNLLDNALDASPAGAEVEISAARQLGSVVVRIVDHGAGIPADIRAKIFDPFFTTKPVGQGTGLGLDIARQLVRHNAGDIEVESRPGHTEFRVSLPAVAAAPASP